MVITRYFVYAVAVSFVFLWDSLWWQHVYFWLFFCLFLVLFSSYLIASSTLYRRAFTLSYSILFCSVCLLYLRDLLLSEGEQSREDLKERSEGNQRRGRRRNVDTKDPAKMVKEYAGTEERYHWVFKRMWFWGRHGQRHHLLLRDHGRKGRELVH